MSKMSTAFADFMTAYSHSKGIKHCSMMGVVPTFEEFNSDVTALTLSDRTKIGAIWEETQAYLQTNNLIPNELLRNPQKLSRFDTSISGVTLESMTSIDANDGIDRLLLVAGIAEDDLRTRNAAVASIGQTLAFGTSGGRLFDMLQPQRTGIASKSEEASVNTRELFSSKFASEFFAEGDYDSMLRVTNEAFGASMDTVLPDIRLAMTINLLRFHNSILNRVFHRRATACSTVWYKVPQSEVYDLDKSNSPSVAIREGNHRVHTVDLYEDPQPVHPDPRRVECRMVNDKVGCLFAIDGTEFGIPLFGHDIDLLGLSIDDSRTQYDTINMTDQLSESVVLDYVLVEFANKDASVKEMFKISTKHIAKFNRGMNTFSAERVLNYRQQIPLRKGMLTAAGAPSVLLDACTDMDYLVLNLNVNGLINLMNGRLHLTGSASFYPHNSQGGDPIAAVKNLATGADALQLMLVAADPDAKFSEENMRKSNTMIRTLMRDQAYEILNARNYMVDYAIQQTVPEYVMSEVTRVMNIGQDYRALMVMKDGIEHVADQLQQQLVDPSYLETDRRIGSQYVAGMMVRPRVFVVPFDVKEAVNTIRSGDTYGDIRGAFEMFYNKLTADLMIDTFYDQELDQNEKIVFKVVTSFPILANIIAAPHYHDHLNNPDQAKPDANRDYVRVLNNGIELEVVTTTFKTFRDLLMTVPYRRSNAESQLNFGHNWDMGSSMFNYQPTIGDAAWKRVFACLREQQIITNPIGILSQVQNLQEVLDGEVKGIAFKEVVTP